MKRMPLTMWAFLVTAILGVLSFPVLLSASLLLVFDRSFGTAFYLSDIMIQGEMLTQTGGSPVLFQHLFLVSRTSGSLYCIITSIRNNL